MRKPFARSTIAVFLALLTWAPFASAYCRLRTCKDGPDGALCRRNSHACIAEGELLFYESPCLSFGVAKGGTGRLEISDQEFLQIVQEAFERWERVDCGGGSAPGLFVQSVGLVTQSEPFFCQEPSLNESVWLLDSFWTGLSKDAIGNTAPVYNLETGEIQDSDVQLNLEKIVGEIQPEQMKEALLSIATHEAGHFLGLAHTDVPDAIMYAKYNDADLLGRKLVADDVDGICEIYPPEHAPKTCPKAGVSQAALNIEGCTKAAMKAAARDEAIAAEPNPSCGFVNRPVRAVDGASSMRGSVAFASALGIALAALIAKRGRAA